MAAREGMELRKATELLEVNTMLTESLELEEILHMVIRAASRLVEAADVFLLYLYDEETRMLRFAGGEGVDEDALRQIAFAEGESITGKVFLDRQPKLFTSRREIEAHMENMTEENERHYAKGVYQQDIKSTFCVPILNRDRCLGVVVVNSYRQDGVFTVEDMKVIEVMAGQSAIAIENARVYEALRQKNSLLETSVSIHNVFYQLMIEGRGLQSILTALERMIGSSVVYRTQPVKADRESAFPIRRGTEMLGFLSFDRPFATFGSMEKLTIEQASLSIVLVLIKENALYEKELHFREQVFNRLLSGLSGQELEAALRYVNWRPDTMVQCILIEGSRKPLWEPDQLIGKEQMVKYVEQAVRSERPDALIFTHAFQLIVLLPVDEAQPAQNLMRQLRERWPGDGDAVFGIGRETPIQALEVTYQEAARSAGYAKRSGIPIVEYSMLGLERLLYEVDRELLERFAEDKLHRLRDAGPVLIGTLDAYIRSNRSQKSTADKLHVHPNTLYYRLKKIEELLETDFGNEAEWIDTVVAFRIFMEIHE